MEGKTASAREAVYPRISANVSTCWVTNARHNAARATECSVLEQDAWRSSALSKDTSTRTRHFLQSTLNGTRFVCFVPATSRVWVPGILGPWAPQGTLCRRPVFIFVASWGTPWRRSRFILVTRVIEPNVFLCSVVPRLPRRQPHIWIISPSSKIRGHFIVRGINHKEPGISWRCIPRTEVANRLWSVSWIGRPVLHIYRV